MSKVSNATADNIIANHRDFRDLVVVSVAGDMVVMTRAEAAALFGLVLTARLELARD